MVVNQISVGGGGCTSPANSSADGRGGSILMHVWSGTAVRWRKTFFLFQTFWSGGETLQMPCSENQHPESKLIQELEAACRWWSWLSLTVTGLVSASLMYSATVIGPVAFILEVRCRSMEGRGFSSPEVELHKSLDWAARHRPVTQKHYKCINICFTNNNNNSGFRPTSLTNVLLRNLSFSGIKKKKENSGLPKVSWYEN